MYMNISQFLLVRYSPERSATRRGVPASKVPGSNFVLKRTIFNKAFHGSPQSRQVNAGTIITGKETDGTASADLLAPLFLSKYRDPRLERPGNRHEDA
jgi:hypothetical protein